MQRSGAFQRRVQQRVARASGVFRACAELDTVLGRQLGVSKRHNNVEILLPNGGRGEGEKVIMYL